MSNTIDLDAKRAARRAKKGEYTTLIVDGHELKLRTELPLTAITQLDENDLNGFLLSLVAPESVDLYGQLDLSLDDCMDIVSDYMDHVGESAASIASSINIGMRPRQTSPGSTTSISPSAVGVSAPSGSPASSTSSATSPPTQP